MSRQVRWSRFVIPIRPGPALALALAAVVAVGLTLGTNLVVSSGQSPSPVRLSTALPGARPTLSPAPGSTSKGDHKGDAGDSGSQSSEPVETVTAPGTVVRLPGASGASSDLPKSTPTPSPYCAADGSGGDGGGGACSSGGG
jgi:hypothetical protein